ncbi:MAG: hypothetical protein IPJ13_28345 [Saprospiraceae bacterium]|nr:hypothetical protein [Saprospiraceae bacterium]
MMKEQSLRRQYRKIRENEFKISISKTLVNGDAAHEQIFTVYGDGALRSKTVSGPIKENMPCSYDQAMMW